MANEEVNVGVPMDSTDEVLAQQRLEDRGGGTLAAVRSPINTEIQKMMMTDAAQSVLQTGYAKEMVQKAIETLMVTEESAVLTGKRIMEAIFSIEEGGIELSSSCGEKKITANEINKHETEGGANANETSGDPKVVQETILKKKQEYEKLLDATLCKICLVHKLCVVFLPCSHLATCQSCAPKLRCCPICRSLVRATVNAYFK